MNLEIRKKKKNKTKQKKNPLYQKLLPQVLSHIAMLVSGSFPLLVVAEQAFQQIQGLDHQSVFEPAKGKAFQNCNYFLHLYHSTEKEFKKIKHLYWWWRKGKKKKKKKKTPTHKLKSLNDTLWEEEVSVHQEQVFKALNDIGNKYRHDFLKSTIFFL